MALKPRLDALTGIRFIACLWVMLHHHKDDYILPYINLDNPLGSLLYKGGVGVDMFFMLSGFILAYNYLDRFESFKWSTYVDFIRARFARVYPAYIATSLLAAALWYAFAGKTLSGGLVVANVLLVQSWFNWTGDPTLHTSSWNGPAWSVSSEWFAYILFPFTFAFFFKVKNVKVIIPAIILLAVVAGYVITITRGSTNFWTMQSTVRIIFGFTIGVLLCQLFRNLPQPRFKMGVVSDVVIIAVLVAVAYGKLWWIAPAFAPALLCLAYGEGLIAKFFSVRWVVYLGEASYSIYLMHQILNNGLVWANRKWGIMDQMGLFAIVVACGVGILGALPVYTWLEVPMRSIIRGRKKTKPVAAPTPVEAPPELLEAIAEAKETKEEKVP